MKPELTGIDHVHVYVSDLKAAERWYEQVLGLTRLKALEGWAVDGGPLTLGDPSDNIHVALFERSEPKTASTIAFGTEGQDFLEWKRHIEGTGQTVSLSDHRLAFSMYFEDPDGNQHEITTLDVPTVRSGLKVAGLKP